MEAQDACIQAAGYLGDAPEQREELRSIVAAVAEAAATSLVGPRRLWVLGGAGALDLPGRPGVKLVHVSGFPAKYKLHEQNYALLCRLEFGELDWSFACPGAMVDAPPGVEMPPARVSVDVLPVALPGWAALLPTALLLPAVVAIKQQLVGPSYEEVAAAMVQHLAPRGPLRHHRVGFAAGAQ
eukprot:scaffold13.g229.t1